LSDQLIIRVTCLLQAYEVVTQILIHSLNLLMYLTCLERQTDGLKLKLRKYLGLPCRYNASCGKKKN